MMLGTQKLRQSLMILAAIGLIFLYQNCSDVNLISLTEKNNSVTIPPTPTPAPQLTSPYVVKKASLMLFGEDLNPGARGRVEIRNYNNQILKSIFGPRPDNQYGTGLVRLADQDNDGVEDFAFANPYNHEYGHIANGTCIRSSGPAHTPVPCQANTDTYYRVFDESFRAPRPSVFVHSSQSTTVKQVFARDSHPHGNHLIEIGDIDGDDKNEILVSYHFPKWFGIISSSSTDMTYIQIPHEHGVGTLTATRDINGDGIKEVWHSSYTPSTKMQHFNFLDIRQQKVIASFSVNSSNRDARYVINEEADDINRDGFLDFVLSDSLTKIAVISGKDLLQNNSFVEISSIPLAGKATSILVGDFYTEAGVEVAYTVGNKLYVHNVASSVKVFEETFEGLILLKDKADSNLDGFDDILFTEYGRGGLLDQSIVYSLLASQRTLHTFRNFNNVAARYFLREVTASATNAIATQLTSVNQVPEESKCARNGARLLIQPNGWSLSGYTWREFGDFDFSFQGTNRVVLGKTQYYSLPFKIADNTKVNWITAPDGQLAPAFNGAYATISECPGDFREKVQSPPSDEPTLSSYCKFVMGNEIDYVLFSTERIDSRCELVPNKVYFFNVIQSDPSIILSGGNNSFCESEECSYLQSFR